MVITKSFNLDINTPWKAPTLYIKQGDVDSRKLQATIRKDGTNYTIPGDATATFRMKKPDGMIVTQDCTISGSVVSVVMDAQCATAAGHAFAEIVLATAGEVVSTFLLAVDVMAAAVTDGDIESHDVLSEYRGLVDEMLRVKGAPLVANTAADMTDTDRVYVYTGSEVGYVNGSWYYYDGAAWTLGGVYNSQGIGEAYQQEVAQMVKQSAVASESDSVPYLFRPTPNPSAILADEEIVGGTIAWNQLCNSASVTVPNGHKYYLLKAGASTITASTGSAVTGLDDGTDMVIDLTAMLGSTIADYLYTLESGTAGAGVAKLREWGFLSKDYFAYDAGSLKSVNTEGKRVYDKNNNLLATYHTTPTNLNGIFKLDANNQLYADGDVYKADGTITRIYHADVIDGGANLTVASVPQHSSGYYYCAIGISSAYTAANNTNLFNDGGYSATSGVVPGHIYEASGGSMIVVVLFDQTITTAAAANTYFASHPLHIVYELASAKQTTDTADPYAATQIAPKGGTERQIDNRSVPVPVGHRTAYSIGVPDVPANASNATLKATVSGGKTTLSWS